MMEKGNKLKNPTYRIFSTLTFNYIENFLIVKIIIEYFL